MPHSVAQASEHIYINKLSIMLLQHFDVKREKWGKTASFAQHMIQ